MELLAAFYEPQILIDAPAHALTGHYPHLRLVCLLPSSEVIELLDDLPAHLRDRVVLEPSDELIGSGELRAILTEDVGATAAAFPAVKFEDIVTWQELPAVYERWLDSHYLPFNAGRAAYTPEGLSPLGFRTGPLTLEFLGSCGAQFLIDAVPDFGRDLGAELSVVQTVQNHPIADHRSPAADATVVVAPLRYMHPSTLDDFVAHPDPERLFAETREHMHAYLDSVAEPRTGRPLFVLGFLEPWTNPTGNFFPARRLGNLKYFVRCLNDELVGWCERHANAHFVDGDELAAAIGKRAVDEGMVGFYAHRGPIDRDNDDANDREAPTVSVARSFEHRSREYSIAILRDIVTRLITLRGEGRVKAVIVDLDNTLWRGLASDGEIGSWNGRPHGLVEALKVCKRRGIFIAIASKNDESYIREHWHELLDDWSGVPLNVPLSLDDFDVVKIDFRPKPETIAEIVDELGILPESVVFVDDNPLEREAVQAAFPRMRVLGAELNYVRRELLHSPFMQAETLTAEDELRASTVGRQAELRRHAASGSADAFLHALQLRCEFSEIGDPDTPAGRRAVQLINKTNQWSLNGRRLSAEELSSSLADGSRLFTGEARDASSQYGIVAAALVAADATVSHLVVSCRVIGMGIDDAFVSALTAVCGELSLAFADTDRNRAARAFLKRHGCETTDGARLAGLAPPSHVSVVTAGVEAGDGRGAALAA